MITLPPEIRKDLERQSLETLAPVKDQIVVIGGWAARAWSVERHKRLTFDIDGIAPEDSLHKVKDKLTEINLKPHPTSWGVKFSKPYVSSSGIPAPPDDLGVQIKMELSPPRIYEDPDHYFEFDLERTRYKIVRTLDGKTELKIKTPEIEYLIANKLGTPSDYRSQYDIATLLPLCDMGKIVDLIKTTDRWRELVLKRIPKTSERIRNPTTEVHDALSDASVDIRSIANILKCIADSL